MENKKLIYFAHPINSYGTSIEKACIKELERCGYEVVNPGCQFTQRHFQKFREKNPDNYMEYFKGMVEACDEIVYLSFIDGKIGAGIWYEVQCAQEYGMKINKIIYKRESVYGDNTMFNEYATLKNSSFEEVDQNKLEVEETRKRIKKSFFENTTI